MSSPYQRLADLLFDQDRTIVTQQGVKVLAELLNVSTNVILHNPDIISAARILLKFKTLGAAYAECLHEALSSRSLKVDLTCLLIEMGANPDHENANHLTAFGILTESYYQILPWADNRTLISIDL